MTPTRDARAVYVISVAAELAGVHPQTLRIYERKGLRRPGPHRRAAAAATATPTSTCCGASRSSPTRGSTWPACSGCSSSRPRSRRLRDRAGRGAAGRRGARSSETHRQYRRDLVPVQQAMVLFQGRRRKG